MGREEEIAYAREHGTRGAATLLKSNVRIEGRDRVTLTFRAKGGKRIVKEVRSRRLCAALARLEPGEYISQVDVIDELGRKFAFPRQSLVLLP